MTRGTPWLSIALALACTRPGPARPRLVEIRVVDRSEAIDTAPLAKLAGERLSAVLPAALGANPHDGDYRLRISVDGDPAAEGPQRALVELTLSPVDHGAARPRLPIVQRAVGEKISIVVPAERRRAFADLVAQLLGDALGFLDSKTRLHLGTGADRLAALRASEPEIVAEAIRLAAEHADRAAVPRLIELLRSDATEQRDRALGALAEIGDRRAVKPITEAARFREVAQLPKVIDALGTLGGNEARAYLEFVASGHDDPDIRELAKEGLARLDRRATAAPHAAKR